MGIHMTTHSRQFSFNPDQIQDSKDDAEAELDALLDEYLLDIPEITPKTLRKDADIYSILDEPI